MDVNVVGRTSLVSRPRLYELLDRAVAGQVTVVAAPAGSGKTMLLRGWSEQLGEAPRRRVAWVSVERGEPDGQRFWLSVLSGLRAAACGDSLAPGAPSPEFDGVSAIERLLADLAGMDQGVVLVIDDLHELTSPDALTQLELLLSRMPPTLHVVLATRRDPHLGLGRLRLSGELSEIRAADLRFSLSEAGQLFERQGIALRPRDLAVLHEHTEGWAAGLRLAAIALEGHPDPTRFVAEFSGSERTVADYLLHEMLDRQPVEVKNLLLCTSVLERVSGPLADVVTGGSDGQRILQALAEDNAFVVALDTGRTWFRYHHLFADLLRLELRRTDPDRLPHLHRAAAGWLADKGFVTEAVRHAQAGGDWNRAAFLLADQVVSLLLNGEGETVHTLLEAFPKNAADRNAELAAAFALDQMLRGSLENADAYLDLATAQASLVPPERQARFERTIVNVRLSVARRSGDLAAAVDQAKAISLMDPRRSADIELWDDLRAAAVMNLGAAELWAGRLHEAQAHLENGLDLAQRIARPYVEIGCLAYLGEVDYLRSLPRAYQRWEQAVTLADIHGWELEPFVVVALVGLASKESWAGRFREAEPWLERANQALRPEAEPVTALLFHLASGLLQLGTGRPDQAVQEFGAADRFPARLSAPAALTAQLRGLRAQTQARLGEVSRARATLAAMTDEDRRWGESRIALAVVELAAGTPRAAADALAPVLDDSVPVVHVSALVQGLLCDSVAHDRLGDRHTASSDVERALDLAEPHGLVLPFVLTGSTDLLERYRQQGTSHGALLADILDVLHGSGVAHPRGEVVAPTDALSDGELRVLRYLPTNLTAPDIAAQLYLSANTVKTHMRSIYAKLGAHRRSEAVHRARELGLLTASGRRT